MSGIVNDPQREYQLIGLAEDGQTNDLLFGKNAKESRQRLQALISEWLRMENLVVLTGAGTSVTSGGKIMDDLERATLETLRLLPDAPSGIKAIIDKRLAQIPQPSKLKFEDWLSYIVNCHFIGSVPNSPFNGVQWKETNAPTQKDLSWFVKWIQSAIFLECALKLPDVNIATDTSNGVASHLTFLAKLVARDNNLGRVNLFTLNYDTLFEQACDQIGIHYFDGFTGHANARFDPSVYGLDIYYPGNVSEGRVRRFDKFLRFYKLHGSIHWYLRNNKIFSRHPDLNAFSDYCILDDPKEKAKKLLQKADQLPAIGILPTANKFVQTLTMPFAHLYRALQIQLSAPQTFFLVLGYGFGDDHLTRILEDSLVNPSLVMLVVEPNPNSATIDRVRKYKDLGKRAFVLSTTNDARKNANNGFATFDDFSHCIMPDVQWLNDFLRMRRFEKQIESSGSLLSANAGSIYSK